LFRHPCCGIQAIQEAILRLTPERKINMNAKFVSLIVGACALGFVGTAQAAEPMHTAEPMQLSVAQLDSVTAARRGAGAQRGQLVQKINLANMTQINNNIQVGVAVNVGSGSAQVSNVATQINAGEIGQGIK
jgi:hypothetical protein